MSRNAVVDLTGNSDDEGVLPTRQSIDEEPKQTPAISPMQNNSNLVDLTGEDPVDGTGRNHRLSSNLALKESPKKATFAARKRSSNAEPHEDPHRRKDPPLPIFRSASKRQGNLIGRESTGSPDIKQPNSLGTPVGLERSSIQQVSNHLPREIARDLYDGYGKPKAEDSYGRDVIARRVSPPKLLQLSPIAPTANGHRKIVEETSKHNRTSIDSKIDTSKVFPTDGVINISSNSATTSPSRQQVSHIDKFGDVFSGVHDQRHQLHQLHQTSIAPRDQPTVKSAISEPVLPKQQGLHVTSTIVPHTGPSTNTVKNAEPSINLGIVDAPVSPLIVTPDIENAKDLQTTEEVPNTNDLMESESEYLEPLFLEGYRDILKTALDDMHRDHEYFVKSRLSRARQHHRSLVLTSPPDRSAPDENPSPVILRSPADFVQHISPFADEPGLKPDPDPGKRSLQRLRKLSQLIPKASKPNVEEIIVPCTNYTAGDFSIPPYTNYISSKRNILIEDDKNRTFLPYHGDDAYIDADYAQLESRIGRNRSEYQQLNAIAEKAKLYGPYAKAFLAKIGCNTSNVLGYLLDETNPPIPEELPSELMPVWGNRETHIKEEYYRYVKKKQGGRLQVRLPQKHWQKVFKSVAGTSTSRQLAAAALACTTFVNLTGFTLWHIVKRDRTILESKAVSTRINRVIDHFNGLESPVTIPTAPKADPGHLGVYADLGCLVCYAHECLGHGEFADQHEKKNIRVRINAKPTTSIKTKSQTTNKQHPQENQRTSLSTVHNALGMNEDKTVSGIPWTVLVDSQPGFTDNELCSNDCFWAKSNRAKESSEWCASDVDLLQTLLPAYRDRRRGPCMLALVVEKPCFEIFLKLLDAPRTVPTWKSASTNASKSLIHRPAARRTFDYWLEHSQTWEHHERPPFKPCNHMGPCDDTTNCHCYVQRVTCEKTCMCTDNCSRKFRGCTCAARGKVCWENDKCDCYRLNRECDPDLCRSCGANEVLDPTNRYNSVITIAKCANVFIQRGVPRRTLLGHSKLLESGGVSGWGLYMGEPTKKGDYIGEYVGEVISKNESEQRGTIYNKRNLSYLFDLNETQTLDSTLVGNKFRYINHQAPPYANCRARTMFCNTTHRIGMFACRNIEVGDEILFDYGEGFASKFDLIKLDDQAQPVVEKRRRSHKKRTADGKQAASKSGGRPGRPRKNTLAEEESKGDATESYIKVDLDPDKAGAAVIKASQNRLKRKRKSQTSEIDGSSNDDESDDPVSEVDLSSSESFHDDDDEDEEDEDEEADEEDGDDGEESEPPAVKVEAETIESPQQRGARTRKAKNLKRKYKPRGGNLGRRPRRYE